MADGPSIARRQAEPEEGSFDALRSEGLRLIAEHSGSLWTDYNLHDPGITILEQLCYGLTDLLYRAEFDVADHLTGPDGSIDYEGQALHLPRDILPCRPTTARDLRNKLLCDVDGLEHVWVRPWTPDMELIGAPGLHVLILREGRRNPNEDAGTREAARDELRQAALAVFLANRNLCEDVHDTIAVAEDVPYELVADVDISGSRPALEILEDVYRVAADFVAGRPPSDSVVRRLEEGQSLDDVLSGPLGERGVCLFDDSGYDPEHIVVADLITRIERGVDGVATVRALALRPPPAPESSAVGASAVASPAGRDVLRLHFDQPRGAWLVPTLADPHPESAGVRLWKGGRRADGPEDTASLSRRYRRSTTAHGYESFASFYRPPEGQHRRLGEYHSVQAHFPAMYGVGPNGIPPSENPDGLARARQLKAYLLLLEQAMANYVENLDHLRELFSASGGPTYRYQVLDENVIPGFRQAYPDPSGRRGVLEGEGGPYCRDPDAHLKEMIESYDHQERRSRLYDHMLATFAEGNPQASLRRFGPPEADLDLDEWVVTNKQRYLEQIVPLTRDRIGAFDYGRDLWPQEPTADAPGGPARDANVTGFRRKVGLLLGLQDCRPRPLTSGAALESGSEGFHVLEHMLLRPVDGNRAHLVVEGLGRHRHASDSAKRWAEFYPSRMSVLFPSWPGRFADPDFRRLSEETVRLNSPAHVLVDCFWLNRRQLARFEQRYGDWLEKRRLWYAGRPASPSARRVGPVRNMGPRDRQLRNATAVDTSADALVRILESLSEQASA